MTSTRQHRRRPTLVSLFTGAGGLDVGLEIAGFATVSAVDNDPACCEALRHNQRNRVRRPGGGVLLDGTEIICAGVETLRARDLQPRRSRRSWRPDLLAGGPPCQPFSSAGRQHGMADDRGRLFEHFVRLADELQPRYILFENVRGIVTARGPSGQPGEVLHVIKAAFESIGYGTNFALLNSADYGSPQRRVRCFMLAARRGPVPEFPPPTHRAPDCRATPPTLSNWKTLGEYLRERPGPENDEFVRPSDRLAEALRDVPCGSGLKSPGARESTRPGGHWGYKQGTWIADPDRPARTVTAASTQDWIRLPDGTIRRLTLRECAGLQGFPDAWRFVGSNAAQFRQVGNAVPVDFGRVLGAVLIQALKEHRLARQDAHSLPFPPRFKAAIAYTAKEHARNGESRARARSAPANSTMKGLGSEDDAARMPLFERQAG